MADHWYERRATGEQHERYVKGQLELYGWTVHPCGQGTYPAAIQNALRHTESAFRQFPDMIAARGHDIVAIDAKTRLESTGTDRYAVSRKRLLAGLQLLGTMAPLRLFYVFGDLRVLTPAEVMAYSCHASLHPSGSYYLVSTRLAHQFDEVFGTPAALRSA